MSELVIKTSRTAMGGTELINARLHEALPELTSQVQIICSRPEQVVLEDRPRILWLHDLAQDPAVAKLRDAGYRAQFNKLVFVSHWQQQQYNMILGVPYSEGVVIKNGIPPMDVVFPKPKVDGKLRFIYTPTPHRGLALLAAAADALKNMRQDWELHVYSSLKLYGWADQDKQFEPLYDALRANPCVVYHGTAPNDEVRQACLDAHVFVYPSVYQETSCMAIQEAMMAGCLAITTNLAGLPETCGEWAWMMHFTEDPNVLAQRTLDAMGFALQVYDEDHVQQALQFQASYFRHYYSWDSRVVAWRKLLEESVKEGVKEEMFIIP